MHFWFFGSGDTYHDVDSFSYFIVELGRKVSYISQIYIHALNLATVCVKTAGLKVHPIARASILFSKSQQHMGSRYLGNFWKSQTNKKKSALTILDCDCFSARSIFSPPFFFFLRGKFEWGSRCFDCAVSKFIIS